MPLLSIPLREHAWGSGEGPREHLRTQAVIPFPFCVLQWISFPSKTWTCEPRISRQQTTAAVYLPALWVKGH